MSTQPRSDLKSTAPTHVSRNAMNPFGAKDLRALAARFSPVGPSALSATAPYRQSELREDFAEYVCAAPLATDVINATIAAEHLNAPASAPKAAGLRSRTAPQGKPGTSEGWRDELASVAGLTVALRRARDRFETASRARRSLAGWSPPRFARTIDGNATAQQRLECSGDRHGGGKNDRTTTSSARSDGRSH